VVATVELSKPCNAASRQGRAGHAAFADLTSSSGWQGGVQALRRTFERERTVRLRLVCFLAGLKSFSIWRSVDELDETVRLRRRARFEVPEVFFSISLSAPSTTPCTRSEISDIEPTLRVSICIVDE